MPLTREIIDRTLATPLGEAAYKVVVTLSDAGYDTWWVGGCVREMLCNDLPDDIDIATAATPDQVLALFAKGREVPRPLGSVRVRLGTHVFEITTFRKESQASDGRIPESVEFSDRDSDAARRDFTINALYFNAISRELYDPFSGEGDLKERLVRFVGNPSERIHHDALRIMRAVRFKSRIDGQYHPDTYKALREHAKLVENLSGIRKLEELDKLLMTPNADKGLEDLWELGILQYIIPELHACKGVAQPADYHHEGDVWNHLLQCVRSFRADDFSDVRLAALLHDIGKVETFSVKERIRFDEHAGVSADLAKKILKRLEASNRRIEKISWLIEHHMMMGAFEEMSDERKAHWYFHQWFPELLQVFWLDVAGTTPSDFSLYDRIVKDRDAFLNAHPRPVTPLLDGKEIMELTGLKPGARVGELLDELHDAQIRGEATTKKEAASFILDKEKMSSL
jgi:putative nucleotidyltransferase with HDIG domain